MTALLALVCGLIFGLGLIAGGMTDPAKVKGFLDLLGPWDPSLALVMGAAIAVAVAPFALAKRRKDRQQKAWSGEPIELPEVQTIDARLIGGGVLFGIGWGIGGFCPGPALVALGSGFVPAFVFVVAMLVGMALHDRWLARR